MQRPFDFTRLVTVRPSQESFDVTAEVRAYTPCLTRPSQLQQSPAPDDKK
jgi:hypothetical protein